MLSNTILCTFKGNAEKNFPTFFLVIIKEQGEKL